MNVNFENGILQIEDVRIIFRNFKGEATKYNREGDRNFAVILPNEEIANELIQAGWNVKIKPPKEEYDNPFIYLPVKVKYNDNYGPAIYVESGKNVTRLNEDTIGMLDDIDITSVSLDIRPYDWDVNGKQGRTAYLQAMNVIQNVDRFGQMHADKLDYIEE